MPDQISDIPEIQIIHVSDLPDSMKAEIITLCSRAYEEDMSNLFELFKGTTHLLGLVDGVLASHAMWVTRWLQVDDGPLLRTAYVEAVATDEPHRGRGYASALMRRLIDEVQGFELAGLSPSDHRYYERLGWEVWRGPLFVRTEAGLLDMPDDEELMIHRLPRTPTLDLTAPISVEWREGEVY